MNWKAKINDEKLVVINATGLAAYDEERCKYCGRYGCVDRGYTLTAGDPPVTISEAPWAAQVQERLAAIIDENKDTINIQCTSVAEPQCVRKLKKDNVLAVVEKLKSCGPDCHRNLDCSQGGAWKERDEEYQCPFRNKLSICHWNVELDNRPLTCNPDNEDCAECEFHEEAYRGCFRRDEGEPCYDIKEKYGASDEKYDHLLMLVHRFSAAPCRFYLEGGCTNTASQHNEGACVLNALMSPCEQYEPVDPNQGFTEGVCTYVSSADGKDDRKVFNTSNYAPNLPAEQRDTLCLACRISHSIAKATGLKCLGVRRASKNPFLNDTNPLAKKAIQINYLYLTHPQDVAKYNPDLIAKAVYDAFTNDCAGLECDEYQSCNFNPM